MGSARGAVDVRHSDAASSVPARRAPIRSATAAMVRLGLTPAERGRALPSAT